MRNTILAAVAALTLVVGTAPSFATVSQNTSRDGDSYGRCADVLANQNGHQASEAAYCRSNY